MLNLRAGPEGWAEILAETISLLQALAAVARLEPPMAGQQEQGQQEQEFLVERVVAAAALKILGPGAQEV